MHSLPPPGPAVHIEAPANPGREVAAPITYHGEYAVNLLDRSFNDDHYADDSRDTWGSMTSGLTEEGEFYVQFGHTDPLRNYYLTLDFARGRVVRYPGRIEDES